MNIRFLAVNTVLDLARSATFIEPNGRPLGVAEDITQNLAVLFVSQLHNAQFQTKCFDKAELNS